ncbi:hypothetical protein [Streptomyces litmocidini]|uniref:hypothetical protein n=1 Tax=Streptomyces litmocidini TaxID=67318 RepID=UPI0036F91A1F
MTRGGLGRLLPGRGREADDRAAAALEPERAITTRPGRHAVIENLAEAVTPVVVSLVSRCHRPCRAAGSVSSMVTEEPETRRVTAANSGVSGPAVFRCLAGAVRQARAGHELAG